MIKLPQFSPFGSFFSSLTKTLNSQSGVAPIFIVLLLVGGIIGGTYLVQQRTNILPFAAESSNKKCGERSGDESKCVKFTVTSCKPKDSGGKCDVKFEWVVVDENGNDKSDDISLRVSEDASGKSVYDKKLTKSGSTVSLPAGKYNAVISHGANGDDINSNNNDKVRFEVGREETKSYGSYSGSKASSPSTRNTTTSNSSTSTANAGVHSGVPELKGNFRRGDPGDFVPKAEKQELLNRFLNPNGENGIKGKVECRNTTAQSNQGNRTGDEEKNASSMWVVADNPDGNVAKEEYIIDCSKSALGSIKSAEHEKIKCGKIKQGDSFKFGCVDTAMSPSSNSSNNQSNNSNNNSRNSTGNQAQTEAPGITEKQLKDCGFSVTESGIPLFQVQVGQHTTDADANCDQLRAAQIKHFEGIIEKARQEAEEARKNGDEAKAKELEEKANEVEKKAAECEDKKDKAFADCAKAASEPAKSAATAAQSAAVKNALKKLESIIAGGDDAKGKCVKADMGITPFLEAQRLKRRTPNDEDRRLLLCRGKDQNNLKWRVLVGGNAGSAFADEDGVDDGNDAERIWGLHGESRDATGDPKYPYTVRPGGKNSFEILDPNVEGNVQKMLEKYIAAAKEGKTTLRSAPVEGDSDGESDSGDGSGSGSGSGSTTFTKLNPSVAKDDAKRQLSFSQESGKNYTCAESSDPKLKYVIVKVENDGSLAKKVEVVCDNGSDRKFVCASKSDNKELGCYNQSDLK